MTISVWRYSHLALAVSSFLFLALASLTGIILAFEPIGQQMSNYRVKDFDRITVAQAVTTLKKTYPGITDIDVDTYGFVTVKGTDAAGKKVLACVDARTGKLLGAPPKQSDFFQWVTAFHRSLFLHEAGRAFVGVIAFLLSLIAVSGTALVIQRQRSFKRFFARIVNENFSQYWHVVLGRLSLIPIIIIALTGTYLSLSRFNFFPDKKIVHKIDIDHMKTGPKRKLAEFLVFKNTLLADVRTIQFPFSEFPEDYFTLKLNDREMVVNQFTGDVLSNISHQKTTIWLNVSLNLHTGRTNMIWALVLAIASANILFFIWSGFAITLKRRSGRVKNKFKVDESEIIILTGSENGSTNVYASSVYKQLIKQGHKAYLTNLNSYETFPLAQHLIIMTATYGLGDAPSNASKFKVLLNKYPQLQAVKYSVLGFGSHAYPDFCQFGFEVNQLLLKTDWAEPSIDIHTVNDKSPADFGLWVETWSQQSGIKLNLPDVLTQQPKKVKKFSVASNTKVGNDSQTFLLRLENRRNAKVTSGDLLAIYPANDHRERLYSIGMVDGQIQLSVKLHQDGLGSEFLHRLNAGDLLWARIVENPHFRFPAEAPSIVMIANGTGIAPFLGMIAQNKSRATVSLYCGFRQRASFEPYADFLKAQQNLGRLEHLKLALSREGEKHYVSDLLAADASFIAKTLQEGGILMLCGSLAMQKDVLRLLDSICAAFTHHPIGYFQSHGQILMDCY